MAGKAYGKTLPFGFRGAVSRQPDTLIQPYTNTGEANIEFGAPVVFDTTNGGVRKIASGDAATDIIGLAVRRMGQPYADDPKGYYYKKGDTVDVLVRGSMTVELKAITGIAARGKVYVDPADGELTSVATDNLAVPNAIFATGNVDSNNVAEVTILSRNI
ncbi:MAG: DUF2190 family protein [Clostridia bacterium]|nr:DUF2190 family protein [Clostridia bacterium]